MFRYVLLIAVLSVNPSPSRASTAEIPQISQSEAKSHSDEDQAVAIGVTAGLLSGVGFSYREFDLQGDGHHIGGIFFGDKSDLFVSVGYERLYRISRYEQSALYWYWGGSVYYTYWENYDCTTSEAKIEGAGAESAQPCKDKDEHNFRLSTGPGLSFEYGMSKGLGVALELPLALSYDWTPPRETSGISIFPIPSIIVQYRL